MLRIVKLDSPLNLTNKPIVTVGIADYKSARNPHVLATYALGSCVAVVLHDVMRSVGGLIHAMLPEPHDPANVDNPYRYVETGVRQAVKDLLRHVVSVKRLEAVIVGGANVLRNVSALNIGSRNVEKARNVLRELGVRLVGEDTGGTASRSVFYDITQGVVYVVSRRMRKLFG